MTTAVESPELELITAALVGDNEEQRLLAEVGLELVAMLLRKNNAYGNSALEPVRIFAKGMSPLDLIHVRMDDKLSRVARGHNIDDEDMVVDLAGYCVLEICARRQAQRPC